MGNKNDVTVTICYLVSSGNDVTVTVCSNDAHLCIWGVPRYIPTNEITLCFSDSECRFFLGIGYIINSQVPHREGGVIKFPLCPFSRQVESKIGLDDTEVNAATPDTLYTAEGLLFY
jgi:hypothetical protein